MFDSPVGVDATGRMDRSPREEGTPRFGMRLGHAAEPALGLGRTRRSGADTPLSTTSRSADEVRAVARGRLYAEPEMESERERALASVVAQCGSHVYTLSPTGQLVRMPLQSTLNGESPIGEVQEIECLPQFPETNDEILFFGANRSQTRLAVVSRARAGIIDLAALSSARALSNTKLHGTLESEGPELWRLSLKSASGLSLVAAIDCRNEVMDGMLDGVPDFRRAEFTLAQENAGGEECPLAAGQRWLGTCEMHRSGFASNAMDMALAVESVAPLAGSKGKRYRVCATAGDAIVRLVDNTAISSSPDPIVAAAWIPTRDEQLVLLTRGGVLRVYDAAGPVDLPVSTRRLPLAALGSRWCTALAFGASTACRDEPGSCGILALCRRLTGYVLCDDGAVLAVAPVGIHSLDSPELLALKDALLEEQTENPTLDPEEVLAWASGAGAPSAPVLVCAPGPSPAERIAQQEGSPPSPSQHGAGAVSLVALLHRNSPVVSFLRGWSCGRVDSLAFAPPVLPGRAGRPRALPKALGAPASLSSLPGSVQSPQQRAGLEQASRRDSPLRDLTSKLSRALAQSDSPLKSRSGPADLVPSGPAELDRTALVPVEETAAAGQDASEAPRVVRADYCAQLVGCTELLLGSAPSLTPSPVYPDSVICTPFEGGVAQLVWVPWANPDFESGQNGGSAFPRVFSRLLDGVLVPSRGSSAVVVEPGVGHLFVYCPTASQLACLDLSSASVNIRGALAVALVNEQLQNQLLADESVTKDDETASGELEALQQHFAEQLQRLSAIPKALGKVKVLDPSNPPAMSLAICSWLRELSDCLLYGSSGDGGAAPATGLMQGLRVGFELVKRRLEEQDKTFLMQQEALQNVEMSLRNAHADIQTLSERTEKIVSIQEVTAEGLEDLGKVAAELRPPAAKEDRRFAEFVTKVGKDVERLAVHLGSDNGSGQNNLASRFEALLANEAALAEPDPQARSGLARSGGGFEGTELEARVRELQERTRELLDRMLDPNGVENRRKVSVYSIEKRLLDAKQNLGSLARVPGLDQSMVVLVALQSGAALELQAALSALVAGQARSLAVDSRLLERAYQSGVRRRLGLHATICPYDLVLARGARVSVLLLEDDVSFESDGAGGMELLLTSSAAADQYSDDDEEESTSDGDLRRGHSTRMVKVALVAFERVGTDEAWSHGCIVCAEGSQVFDACEALLVAAASGAQPQRVI